MLYIGEWYMLFCAPWAVSTAVAEFTIFLIWSLCVSLQSFSTFDKAWNRNISDVPASDLLLAAAPVLNDQIACEVWTQFDATNPTAVVATILLALLKVFFPRLNRTSIIWRANLHFTVLFQWALHDLVVCPTIDYMSLYQKHGMQSPFYSCFCLDATRKSKGHCEAWSLPRLRRDCRGLNLTDYGNPYQPHKGLKMNI